MARASAFQAEGRGFESRFPLQDLDAHIAQEVEHFLGKEEVSGSSPDVGSISRIINKTKYEYTKLLSVKEEGLLSWRRLNLNATNRM